VADTGGTNRYTYDPANNVVIVQLANGTWRTNFYDALNRVTDIFHAAPTGVFSSFRYTLGPAGNRVSVQEETGRQVRYDYDSLYCLTRETVTGDPGSQNFTGAYVYDSVGNRLYFTNSLEGTTAYAYDDNDQLLTESLAGLVTRYSYDDNGNTLSRSNATGSASYAWNAENRLVAATVTGTNGVSRQLAYAYDDDGIRMAAGVTESGNTTVTTYLVDANRPFAQVLEEWISLNSQPSTLNVSYSYGHQLLSQNRAGIHSYYHADHLGSTRSLTGQTGSPTDRYAFDAYGRTIGQTGPTANDYLFAGEQRDKQLDLDYLRARYLNVAAGRFYGRDSFDGGGKNPLSLNRYSYVKSNPINSLDPSGNIGIEIAIALSAYAVVALFEPSESFASVSLHKDCFAEDEPLRIIQLLLVSETETYQRNNPSHFRSNDDLKQGLVLLGSVIWNRIDNASAVGHSSNPQGVIKHAGPQFDGFPSYPEVIYENPDQEDLNTKINYICSQKSEHSTLQQYYQDILDVSKQIKNNSLPRPLEGVFYNVKTGARPSWIDHEVKLESDKGGNDFYSR
jgi:RHS repeat-associated protein